MSPIDDELRTALSSRTQALDLSDDFLPGVERRAGRMRRNRVAASIAGSALAVGAIGVGGPVLASALSRDTPTGPVDQATSAPTLVPPSSFALDPSAPWAYRGDPLDQGTIDSTAREWGTARGLPEEQVRFSPLYGETSGDSTVLVFVASGGDVDPSWGVARSSESGPELVVDEPLTGPTYALPYAFTSTTADDVERLLVVASPETSLEYGANTATEWRALESVAPGVGATDLDGDQATDQVRVVGPDGPLTVLPAPSPAAPAQPAAPEDEGPGTDTPLDVDAAPYAWSTADPWAYRGPVELDQHPDLGSMDERLFTDGRGQGWSSRPLLGVERPDGLSILVVLHTKGPEALVSTTWQRQDEQPQQAQQAVADGQLLLQSVLPESDGTSVLLALGAPRLGAVETDVRGAEQQVNEQGWALWTLAGPPSAGSLFLYSEGDGLLFHDEPVRR